MPGLAVSTPPAPLRSSARIVCRDAVTDLVWDVHGTLIAGTADGEVRRLSPVGERLSAWQAHAAAITRVCPYPGNGPLATAGEDGRVKLWSGVTHPQPVTLMDELGWIEHLNWTPDGSILAAAAGKTISLWRGAEAAGVWYDPRRRVLDMAWAPDSRRLASASNKGLFLWRVGGNEPMQLLEYPGASISVAWKADGSALAVGTQDGFLRIWQRGDGRRKARTFTLRGYTGKVTHIAWHPRRMIVASAGGADVVLWKAAGKGAHNTVPLRWHGATITALAYSPDNALLASADRAGRLCVWGKQDQTLQTLELDGEPTALRWRADGRYLALGSREGVVQIYATAPV